MKCLLAALLCLLLVGCGSADRQDDDGSNEGMVPSVETPQEIAPVQAEAPQETVPAQADEPPEPVEEFSKDDFLPLYMEGMDPEAFFKEHPELKRLKFEDGLDWSRQVDLNGDGIEETLSLRREDVPEMDGNNPLTVTMSVGDVSAVYKDYFNDGVSACLTDLNEADAMLDICILHQNTDVSIAVYIYRYDGAAITQVAQIEDGVYSFLYTDHQGKIWYPTYGVELEGLQWTCLDLNKAPDIEA